MTEGNRAALSAMAKDIHFYNQIIYLEVVSYRLVMRIANIYWELYFIIFTPTSTLYNSIIGLHRVQLSYMMGYYYIHYKYYFSSQYRLVNWCLTNHASNRGCPEILTSNQDSLYTIHHERLESITKRSKDFLKV